MLQAYASPGMVVKPSYLLFNTRLKNGLYTILFVGLIAIMQSCGQTEEEKKPVPEAIEQPIPKPVKESVTTAEQQKALTPAIVLQNLKDGNKRFADNNVTARDHSKLVRDAVAGQYPKSVILSCLDSRIPVEDVFDKGIGDMFVARVAGNVVNTDILGSMEYACKVSGSKLIVIMGHSSCGAVKSAIDNVQLGNITGLLAKIKPAIKLSQQYAGEKTSKNVEYTDVVGNNNVLYAIEQVKKLSPVLNELIQKEQIKIVGAYYDMKTGRVTFTE